MDYYTMKSIFWWIISYQVLVYKNCYTSELKVEIELTEYTWRNMDKVQKFFRKVFPIEYQIHHFVEMMYGDLVRLAFRGKKLIGFLYSHTHLTESNIFVISSIGCLPKYRRHGVGSYLFELALNYAEHKGSYNIIRLYVQTCNLVAIKFYKKYGFKIIKEEPDYYFNTVNADAYKMEKIIHSLTKVTSSTINKTNEQKPVIRKFLSSNINEKNLCAENLTERGNDNVYLMFAMKLKEILKKKFDNDNE